MVRIKFFETKEKENCVTTNFIFSSKDKYIKVAKQSEIFLLRNSFVFVAGFNGYTF